MKINNINDVMPQPAPGTPRPAPGSKDPVVAAAPSASVTLSTLSSQVAEVTSGLKNTDVAFDAQKVAAVKARLDDGSYQVSPERIAERLMSQVAFGQTKVS